MMISRQRILRLMPLCLAATLPLLLLTGSASVLADPPQSGNSDSSKNQDDKSKSKSSDDKSDSSSSRNKNRNKDKDKDSDETPKSKKNNSSNKDDDSKSGSSGKKSSSSSKDDDSKSKKNSDDKDKDKSSSSSRSKSKSKSDDDDSDSGKHKKTASKDDDDKKKTSSKDKDKDKDSKADVAKHNGDDKDSDKKKSTVKVDSGKKDVDDKKQASSESKPEAGAKDVTGSRGDHKMEPTEGEFENHEASTSGKTQPHGKPEATTSSTDMQGWELVRLDGRDYVTSASLQKFYHFTQHQMSGNSVELRSSVLVLQGNVGSQDMMINGIKFILSYPVAEYNGKALFSRLDLCKLIDPVLRPSFIANTAPFDTVIIDPGHGGHDSGARGIFGYEKDYALQLGFLLKTDLERRGLKVVMTRSDDTFISLGGRVEMANKVPNSIFVALHFNSGPNAATGIETYALSPQGSSSVYGARDVDSVSFSGNTRDSENIALATAVHAMVVHHFRLVDRGVKRARWYVLTGLQRPGILFEGGFVTNEGDGRLIAAENFRLELAKTIGDAIMNYRRALQPHPAAYQGR